MFLFLVHYSLFTALAQNRKIDSLLKVINTHTSKAGADTTRANALINICREYEIAGNNTLALQYGNSALALAQKSNYKKGEAKCLHLIGNIYLGESDFPKALDYYLKSLKIAETLGDKKGMANSYSNIGTIYTQQNDLTKAIEFYFKGLEMNKALDYKEGMANNYTGIGNIYSAQNNFAKAFDYYLESLKIFETLGNRQGMAISYNCLGYLYTTAFEKDSAKTGLTSTDHLYLSHTALLDSSLVSLKKALQIDKELGDEYYITYCLLGIGNVFYNQAKYNDAIDYYHQSFLLAEKLGALNEKKEAAKHISDSYKKLKEWEKAYSWFETYIAGKDSVFNEAKNKEITRKELKFEYDKKAVADSVKTESETKVISAELKQEQTRSYALYGGVALLLVFGGFMFSRFRVTQKQKQKITEQKILVDEKQKEITDSITYAKRIQYSLLAPSHLLDDNLNEHFVLFLPKDIVSGDFYWAVQKDDSFYLAVCDCTGHGVPGAFMSLLNINFLNEAIIEKNIKEPNEVFNYVRKKLIENTEAGSDGMDATLVRFQKDRITYASANHKPLLLSGGTLTELQSDKMPIGKGEKMLPFSLNEINCKKGDHIYLFTDGFADQFGGEKGGKKLTRKRFKELILSLQHTSIQQQGVELNKFITDYRKELEQIDDILVMGVSV